VCAPRLSEAIESTAGALAAATPAGGTPSVDALLDSVRDDRTDERALDGLVLDDLPDVAHLFRWAIAAELLTARAAKIVPGLGNALASAATAMPNEDEDPG
jgi:hypothetical protein